MKFIRFAFCLLLAISAGSVDAARFPRGSAGLAPFVAQLKIGGGGWTTRCMTGTNSTTRCRTDTYGGFQWDGSKWNQMITQTAMPAANFGYFPQTGTSQVLQGSGGIYSMGISASGSTVYFMYSGKVFVSTNNGASYVYDNLTTTHVSDPNGPYRQEGSKLAVDPNNADHVIAGSDQDGLFETLNGTAGASATWTSISPAIIPTAVVFSGGGGGFPSYNIAFDPASAHTCRLGSISTCTVYVFAYTESAGTPNGKLWKSTDGGSSYTGTTSGPTTMADLQVAPTGGAVFATDETIGNAENGGQLWTYTGTWAQVSGVTGHSIAINPASALKIAVARNDGAITYSSNGGSAWSGYLTNSLSSPTIPWITKFAGTGYLANGNISYDPSATDALIQGAGLGPWRASTTGLTTGSTVAWTASMDGSEQLVAMDGIAPNGVPVVGVEDKSSWYLSSPNSYPSDGANTYQDQLSLMVTYALDYAGGNKNFMAQLALPSALPGGDNSGTSSDGGKTWAPYNSWKAAIPGTAFSNCAPNSNHPTVDISAAVGNQTTTALTTWAAGAGTMLKVIAGGTSSLQPQFVPITVLSPTTLRLDGALNCSNYDISASANYQLIVSTAPLSDYNGALWVTGAANNGSGAIRVTFASMNGALTDRNQVCISGIATGTTEANGCWQVANPNNGASTVDLVNSTFTHAYTGNQGIGKGVRPFGGYNAVASSTNITEWSSNNDYPRCTTDGGQTWADLTMTSQPQPAHITNATFSATGIGQATFTTSVATNILVGENFNVFSVTPSGYNHSGSGAQYIAIAGTTGTTVVGQLSSGGTLSNPGAYTSGGVLQPQDTGWSFAYFTFRHAGAADRVTANTFYSYNYLRGVYKHTNCGTGSIVSNSGAISNNLFAGGAVASLLKSVPGYAGHLFFAPGGQGVTNHPSTVPLSRSTDGGATWPSIANVSEPIKIDCGAIAPGSDYPTCYMVGWVDQGSGPVYGIWRTTATAAQWASGAGTGTSVSWTKVSDYPLGSMDGPIALVADGVTWNKWYIGFGGSGFAYGQQN